MAVPARAAPSSALQAPRPGPGVHAQTRSSRQGGWVGRAGSAGRRWIAPGVSGLPSTEGRSGLASWAAQRAHCLRETLGWALIQRRPMLVCHTPAPQDRGTSPPSVLPARRRSGQSSVKTFSYTFRRSPENARMGAPAAPGAILTSGPHQPGCKPRLGWSQHREPERLLRKLSC